MSASEVGNLIREKRDKRELSQGDVAAQLHVTPGAVSQWEKGRTTPRPEVARALDDLLHAGGEILEAIGYGSTSAATDLILTRLDDIAGQLGDLKRSHAFLRDAIAEAMTVRLGLEDADTTGPSGRAGTPRKRPSKDTTAR